MSSPHAFFIHGHFYQPPREDPLTGAIPVEPGSAPYANWNERIYAECYAPNAARGNFGRVSFDVGPTLFTWLDQTHPETSRQIIQQDQENMRVFNAGNAMAQAYNHTILPLATRRDQRTQVLWGIADFRHHFGRRPRGMWLPEAAVSTPVLSTLVDCGIEFVILAPWQAAQPPADPWQPGRVRLPGDRRITAFIYDQELSTRISFDPGSTVNADQFAVGQVARRFAVLPPDQPGLLIAASDGELYGHHQPFREQFLAYLLDGALTGRRIEPTYPELWLKQHMAVQPVTLRENSSWSCHHGVQRWCAECGCTASSTWKAPLRRALDGIARQVDRAYLSGLQGLIPVPWKLRNRYIHVILGEQTLEELAGDLAGRRLNPTELHRVELLLRAQYERQRMFTSCGWFFEDFDRIEPRNNVAYAAQAVWLIREAVGFDISGEALRRFARVISNRTGLRADAVFHYCLHRAQAAFFAAGPSAGLDGLSPSSNRST